MTKRGPPGEREGRPAGGGGGAPGPGWGGGPGAISRNLYCTPDAAVDEVAAVARAVNERTRSMGMALTSCTVPAAGKPTFELGADEMEIGIGI
ncbi:dihydroxyacetone kinase subunit DhaK, partial [Nocardia neocaledoniensis]|uniref:dihydroxyacetone kinase subunit DhaK n=1 Tax=Nocardia neocaledoniensis TaxID=236511 RepID=UPI002458B615